VVQFPQALECATAELPDAVLMDVRLPECWDGIETNALLRRRTEVPVVYLSGYSDGDIIQARARAADNVCGFLVKPCRERELCAALETARRWLRSRSVRTAANC